MYTLETKRVITSKYDLFVLRKTGDNAGLDTLPDIGDDGADEDRSIEVYQ